MDRRTSESWDRLAREAAQRMDQHDALDNDLRAMSNEHGLATALDAQASRDTMDFLGL